MKVTVKKKDISPTAGQQQIYYRRYMANNAEPEPDMEA